MPAQSKIIWVSAGVLASVLGASLYAWVVPAQPRPAIQTAESFVGFLKGRKLEQAYRLTTQKDEVGRSLTAFQTIVDQQWPGVPTAPVKRLAVGPFQSHGNRWRRWMQGREVELPELRVEFSVGGVPFEVRERNAGHGEWKVSYFQSHAG